MSHCEAGGGLLSINETIETRKLTFPSHRNALVRGNQRIFAEIHDFWVRFARLVDAAHRIWERARLVVIRYLADDTDAAEIVEAAVDSASRRMGNHHTIQCFEAYLFRSVVRESFRRFKRSQKISYLDNGSLERIAAPVSLDLDRTPQCACKLRNGQDPQAPSRFPALAFR